MNFSKNDPSPALPYVESLKNIQLRISTGGNDTFSIYQSLLNALSLIRTGNAQSSDPNATNITDEFFLALIQLFQLEMKLVFMPALAQSIKKPESAKGILISNTNGNISVSLRRLVYSVAQAFLSESQPATSLGFMMTNTLVNAVATPVAFQGNHAAQSIASQFDADNRRLASVVEYTKGLSMRLLRRIAQTGESDAMVAEIALPPTLEAAIHRAISRKDNPSDCFGLAALVTVLFAMENEQTAEFHDFAQDLRGVLNAPGGCSEAFIGLAIAAVYRLKGRKATDSLVPADARDRLQFVSQIVQGQGEILTSASELVNSLRVISLAPVDTSSFSPSGHRSPRLSAAALLPLIRVVRAAYGSHTAQNHLLRHFLVGCLAEPEDFIVLEAANALADVAACEQAETRGKCPEYLVLALHALQRNLKIHRNSPPAHRAVDDCADATVFASLSLMADILCVWKTGVPSGILQDLDELTLRALPFCGASERAGVDCITTSIVNSASLLVKLIRRVILHIPSGVSSAASMSAVENGANIVRLGIATVMARADGASRPALSGLFREFAQQGRKLMRENDAFLRLFTGILFGLLDGSAPFASRMLVMETIGQLLDVAAHLNIDANESMLPGLIADSMRIIVKLIEESTEVDNQGSSDVLVGLLTSNLEKLAVATLTAQTRQLLRDLCDASTDPASAVAIPEEPFQTTTEFHGDFMNDALRCLVRYILLSTGSRAKSRGLHALFRIALAFTPHCLARRDPWPNLPRKIQQRIRNVSTDMQHAHWSDTRAVGGPSLSDTQICIEAKAVVQLIERGYAVLKEIDETRLVPKNAGLQLLQCIHAFENQESPLEAESPTLETQKDILSFADNADASGAARFDRETLRKVTGRDVHTLRRTPSIRVTPVDGISQDRFHEYDVVVTPLFSESHLILEYEVTNRIGCQERAAEIPSPEMTQVTIKVSTCEDNWLVDDYSIQDTTVPRIGPEETGRLVVCIPLHSTYAIERIRCPPKFHHELRFSQDQPENLLMSRNDIRSFHLPDFVLPFESIVGEESSVNSRGTTEQPGLDALSCQWKSLEPPANSTSCDWELTKVYKFDSLTNISETVDYLSSHTGFVVISDPKERAVKKTEGQTSGKGYFVVWMCGSFLPEVTSRPVMLKCKFAFGVSGSAVCQLTVRGMNADVRAQLCAEIFDVRLSCVSR